MFHKSEIWNAYGDDLWRFGQPKKDLGASTSDVKADSPVFANVVGGSPSFDDGNYGNLGFQGGKLVLPLVEPYHPMRSCISRCVGACFS